MTTLRETLVKDPLAQAEADLRVREIEFKLGVLLPAAPPAFLKMALWSFVESRPWRYWSCATVEQCLGILEASVTRSVEALNERARDVGAAFENLFRPSPTWSSEEPLSSARHRDLVRVATEFHPEYLRLIEHILGPSIVPYWSVLKKGSVQGRFNLKNGVQLVASKGHGDIVSGYREEVRNAIAHGQVGFRSMEIAYGPTCRMSAPEFLRLYDMALRSANALCLSLLLFAIRNDAAIRSQGGIEWSPTVSSWMAGAAVGRHGLGVLGSVEQDLPNNKRQLVVAVRSAHRSRPLALLDSARIAFWLIESGVSGYERFAIDLDQGKVVNSLVIVNTEKILDLLRRDASLESINEIFEDVPLLWFKESMWSTRLRAYPAVIRTSFRLRWVRSLEHAYGAGFYRVGDRYRIRHVENKSAGPTGRIQAHVVLRREEDGNDRATVRAVIEHVVKKCRRRWVKVFFGGLDPKFVFLRRPTYIWVSLYGTDGTVRWLAEGRWHSGNLIAEAERIRGLGKPIFVREPEYTWNRIRVRLTPPHVSIARPHAPPPS